MGLQARMRARPRVPQYQREDQRKGKREAASDPTGDWRPTHEHRGHQPPSTCRQQ
jgi:hypothetical protein